MLETMPGQCLCGAVRFVATGEVNRVSACYCKQCTRQNAGGPFYGVELQGDLNIENEEALQWYAASPKAKRGFCKRCGSSLFWQANADHSIFDISLGTLDHNEHLSLDAHIFVDYCPAYISIAGPASQLTEEAMFANLPTDD